MAKNPKITTWKALWDNLKWGPRGALIAFILSVLYFFLPLVPRVILYLAAVIIITIAGALLGVLVEWLIEKSKKD